MARRKNRIFTRPGPDGTLLYYGDFRDLGGGREALKPSGKARGRATSDPDVAEALCAARVEELLKQKHAGERQTVGIEQKAGPGLKAFAAHHLAEKAKSGKFSERWLADLEKKLTLACTFFGDDRQLDSITPKNVLVFLESVGQRAGRRGNATLSGQTRRHYLNALSGLYKRAQQDEHVPPGFNPAAAIIDKPTGEPEEANWLEPHEAALLLEAARLHEIPKATADRPAPPALPPAMLHALIATMLLTGGRKSEILGLEVGDISFTRRKVTFRPNQWRGLKTRTSRRSVPLWPQLEAILREYIKTQGIAGGLLFPSPRTEDMIDNFDKSLDAIAEKAGWKPGEIRTKAFRHTYCAARLQTLDRGAPVATFTVARELGHGGLTLVNRVYGHMGEIAHRSEVVEYTPALIHGLPQEVRPPFLARLEALRAVRAS